MNQDTPIRLMAEEWNARAKAAGRYLEQEPWTLPPLYEGSILDLPRPPEAEERIRQLDALLAELEGEKSGNALKPAVEEAQVSAPPERS